MSERPGPGALVATGMGIGVMAGGIGALALWVLLTLYDADVALMKVIAPALIGGCSLAMGAVNLGRYQFVLLQNLAPPQRDPDPPEDVYVDQRSEYEEAYEGSFEEAALPGAPGDIKALTREIARCAMLQAVWQYGHSENPTREKFTKRELVSQPVWNSGRFVLKTIGMVSESSGWADGDYGTVMALFSRVRCENNKIWVPLFGKSGQFKYITISPQLIDNSHASIGPPHSVVR